ncbi:DUF4236 domain-containing protein [Ectothiorhodospira lacustris]|uniref:DUF4236 domain-containing protein n=1 Tax=Ectothiorhodospira lacustris TaxID=2899127 RepID=UPI001EE7CE1A|nr:DUF4236 domain-containing protein [Ectothiorhodospira lacustris]MCG5509683.1 DUF4236 domain-containing protein [Ectothiorhodospira lacustris]MCG5523084.1 DUF4236 domain-containing protein [Ectothiorhodospira lacustris]
MGFYIRKAISVGPFRFNLSKSGVGVSAGVKGLRFGTGPRGNYVHMGRGVLYYRKTLPSGSTGGNQAPNSPELQQSNTEIGHEPLREIESAHITQMVDSSSADLVAEMNANRKKVRIWPFVAVLGAILTFIAFKNSETPTLALVIAAVSVALTVFASVKDNLRKTTVLFFDLEPEIESLYQKLHHSFEQLSSSSSKWHIEAEGAIKDRKRNAGATNVIKRTSISLGIGNPPYVKTNVSIPSIPVGRQTLYFFPDKVLIFEPNGVGAVSYPNLRISVESTRFIEDGSVPKDAKVVDRTWKYVNKRGGPDKRFKDNLELPITLYEDLNFTSDTGLNERIEISRVGHGDGFSSAIAMLAKSI